MQSLDELRAGFDRPDGVAFEASPLGGVVARLRHGNNAAVVALQGAQVLSWQHGPREMLWLSPVARLGTGRPVRGGIPVCWPWFGPHPDDDTRPAHGFVRAREWTVVAAAASPAGALVRFAITTGSAELDAWPQRAEVQLEVTLGDGLALSLTTRNLAGEPLTLTQALHTYFRISEIGNVAIDGLAGLNYVDKLDGGAIKPQTRTVTFDGEVDRIYLGDTSAIRLMDSGGRELRIASSGSRSAVVWNPWREKTIRLGDMGADNAFRRMVCVETANAGDDIVRLAPGAKHTLAAAYAIA